MLDFIRKKDIEFIKEKGDKALDFDKIIGGVAGKVAEAGDGLVLSIAAKQINSWLTPQLPEEVKKELHDVFDEIEEKDYKEALIQLADVGEALAADERISLKLRPWVATIIEIYKGIISSVIE